MTDSRTAAEASETGNATGDQGDQKVALITGANKGIGRAIAEQLGSQGMTVLVGSRDVQRGQDVSAGLRSIGTDAHQVTLDVTDSGTIQAVAEHIDRRFGRLDVLINNAGISGSIPAQVPTTADLDVVREVFETNVFGMIAVTNAMVPLLRRSPEPRIVNVSSHVGSLGHMTNPGHYLSKMPGSAAYPPSKTALNALTVQYAKELGPAGILVNAAAPGACATDFTKHLGLSITRTAAQGAAIAVHLATLGPDGPTGGFFDDDGPVPW